MYFSFLLIYGDKDSERITYVGLNRISFQVRMVSGYYVGQGEFQTGHQTNFFLEKIRTSRVCLTLKTIWSYCTLINVKFR